jgi:FtsZ-interacting cell division protein ZipA|tara:strand:+ start:898 stop:1566 length:669 start_codon:yes stop_codon:yes gene_type:complete
MFNLSETLTIIIGLLLVLVLFDGIRRSRRTKKSKLKVELMDGLEIDKELESSVDELYVEDYDLNQESQINSTTDTNESEEFIKETSHDLFIFNIKSLNQDTFNHSSISEALEPRNSIFDNKGFFLICDDEEIPIFTLINSKKPGTLFEGDSTGDISLFMDPSKSKNPLESFNLLLDLSSSLADTFHADLLDENRNHITKQMLAHLKQKAQEYQRQNFTPDSV